MHEELNLTKENELNTSFHYDIIGLYKIDGDTDLSLILTSTGTSIAISLFINLFLLFCNKCDA
jgi:hypothetical protein